MDLHFITASELQHIINSLNDEVDDIHAASIAFTLQDETVASALVGARTTSNCSIQLLHMKKVVQLNSWKSLENLAKCINMMSIEFDNKKNTRDGIKSACCFLSYAS